jgi:hypothetical protein
MSTPTAPIKNAVILSLLSQYETLVLSETVISSSANLSLQHVERMKEIQKSKLEEKQFKRAQYLQRSIQKNHLEGLGWTIDKQTLDVLGDSWEQRFDEKGLFRANVQSLSKCIIDLCDNAEHVSIVMSGLRRTLESFTVTEDQPHMAQHLKNRKKQFNTKKEIPPINYSEQLDDSIDCYILQTMRQCFDHYASVKHPDEKIELSADIFDSCFARITIDVPYAIRYQSALLLGSLAECFLDKIIDHFLTKLDKVNPKKDTEVKEYAVYQQVMKCLRYSVETPGLNTIKLMQTLFSKMPQIQKGTGVFYPEACGTLNTIFSDVLTLVNWPTIEDSSKTAWLSKSQLAQVSKRRKQWEKYSAVNGNVFWKLFIDVFEMLAKICNKASKHRLSTTVTLLGMLTRFSDALYTSSNGSTHLDNVLKHISAGLKEKKERPVLLNAFLDYLKNSPEANLQKEVTKITNFVSTMTGVVFNKKTTLSQEEGTTIEQFLVQYARINLPSCMKVIEDVMKDAKASVDKKCIVMNALAKISITYRTEMAQFFFSLGPLTSEILTNEKSAADLALVRSVLPTFPRVKPPSEESMKNIRKIIADRIIHPDSQIANSSSIVLQTCVELEPSVTFVDILDNYLRVLLKVDEVSDENAIRLLQDLSRTLEIFIDCCMKDSNISVDAKSYVTVRHKLEGLALTWLVHPTSGVRAAAVRFIVTLSQQDLRDVTGDTETPYLLDGPLSISKVKYVDNTLVDDVSKNYDVETEGIWNTMKSLCEEHYDNTSVVFSWSELAKHWNAYIAQEQQINHKNIVIFANLIKFMCITMSPSNVDATGTFINELLSLLNTKNKNLHQRLHSVVLEALYCIRKECLKIVINQVRGIGAPRNQSKDKKRIEASDILYEDNLLKVLLHYLEHTIPEDYLFIKEEEIVRDNYEQLILNWTTKPQLEIDDIPGSVLTAETWKKAVQIISVYLTHLYNSSRKNSARACIPFEEDYTDKSPMIKKKTLPALRRAIFDFVSTHPLASIEQGAVDALQAILKFADIPNYDFIIDILEYYHTVIANYKVDENAVVESMAALFEQNPQYFRSFISKTHAEILSHVEHASDLQKSRKRRLTSHVRSGSVTPTSGLAYKFSKSKTELEQEMQQQQQAIKRDTELFDEAIHDICGYYMKAIAVVLDRRFEEWVEQKHTTVATCLFLALLNSCASQNPRLRYASLEVLKTLCDTENNKLAYGSYLVFHCVDDEATFTNSVIDFSAYCANMDPVHTSEIFSEAEKVIADLNDYNRELILRIIEPWAFNYGKIKTLKDSLESGLQHGSASQILKSVYSITRKLTDITQDKEQKIRHSRVLSTASSVSTPPSTPTRAVASPLRPSEVFTNVTLNTTNQPRKMDTDLIATQSNVFQHYLEHIWRKVMESRQVSESVVSEVIDFVLDEYEYGFEMMASTTMTKGLAYHRLLRSILTYCARDKNSTPAILETLMKHINKFDTELPSDKMDLVLWQLKNGVDPDRESSIVTKLELAVFQLLAQLSYDHDVAFIPHVPLLFVNIVVILNSTQATPKREGAIILENLFQTLVIRKRQSDNLLRDAVTFMKQNFRDKTGDVLIDGNKPYSRNKEFLTGYVRFLSLEHCPDLAKDICKLALHSAMEAKDKKISLESYYVFYHLNTEFNYELVDTLSTCLFEAVRVRNSEKVTVLLNIIESIPDEVAKQAQILNLLLRMLSFVLFTWNSDHFDQTLTLLFKHYQIATNDKVFTDLGAVLYKAWEEISEHSVEVILSRVLVKGFFHLKTFDKTWEMCHSLIKIFNSHMDMNNMLFATLSIVQFMSFCSGDFSKKVQFFDLLSNMESKDSSKMRPFVTMYEKYLHKFAMVRLSSMIDQSTETYRYNVESFTSDFATVYSELFNDKNGHAVMQLLVQDVLASCHKGWKPICLCLFSKLLPTIYSRSWTTIEVSDIGNKMKECMASDRELEATSARNALYFMQSHMNQEHEFWQDAQANSMFAYLSPIRGYEHSLRLEVTANTTSDPVLFIGSTQDNINQSRKYLLKAIWIACFGLSAELNSEQADMLNSLVDNNPNGLNLTQFKTDRVARPRPKSIFVRDYIPPVIVDEEDVEVEEYQIEPLHKDQVEIVNSSEKEEPQEEEVEVVVESIVSTTTPSESTEVVVDPPQPQVVEAEETSGVNAHVDDEERMNMHVDS